MPSLSMFYIIPRVFIPILSQKLLQARGKLVMKRAWRKLVKEALVSKQGSPEDKEHLANIPEAEVVNWIAEGKIDALNSMLIETGLSSGMAGFITTSMQKNFIDLAKSNPLYFYEFMVEAEKAQLEGIQQLKASLGLDDTPLADTDRRKVEQAIVEALDSVKESILTELREGHAIISEDTASILHNQEIVIELLKEIGYQLGTFQLTRNSIRWLDDYVEEGRDIPDGGVTRRVRGLLTHAVDELDSRRYEAASRNLLRSAFLLFNMYKIVKQRRFYELGNRCYLLGNALINE